MSDCHDPYRELELYLAKAEEEIGKACEDLQRCEVAGHPNDTRVTPVQERCQLHPSFPPGPTAHRLLRKTASTPAAPPSSPVSRLCCNGNLLQMQSAAPVFPKIRPPLKKSLSSPPSGSFFSGICSTNCPLRSRLNGDSHTTPADRPVSDWNSHLPTEEGRTSRGDPVNGGIQGTTSPKRFRARSFSDGSPPVGSLSSPQYSDTLFLPPYGDVNLIALWADKLVLELDRTLGSDLPPTADVPTSEDATNRDFSSSSSHRQEDEGSTHIRENGNGPSEKPDRPTSVLPLKLSSVDDTKDKKTIFMATLGDSNERVSPGPTSCPSPDSGIDQVCFDTYDTSSACATTSDTRDFCVQTSEEELPPLVQLERSSRDLAVHRWREHSKALADRGLDSQTENTLLTTQTNVVLTPGSSSPRFPKKGAKNGPVDEAKKVNRLARVIPSSISEDYDVDTESSSCVMMPEVPGTTPEGATPLLQRKLPIPEHQKSTTETRSSLDHPNVTPGGITSKPSLLRSQFGGEPAADRTEVTVMKVTGANQDDFKHTPGKLRGERVGAKKCLKRQDNVHPDAEVFVGKSATISLSSRHTYSLDRQVSSLPRGRSASPTPTEMVKGPQRSASSSAVTSLSKVSRLELEDFMQKVKTSTYHPPPDVDPCRTRENGDYLANNKEMDNDLLLQRDAITQTSPQLSRSSSFTWVTECDCSDWEGPLRSTSGSEDSLLFFSSCSNPDDLGRQMSQSGQCDSDSSLSLSECSTKSGNLSDLPEDKEREQEEQEDEEQEEEGDEDEEESAPSWGNSLASTVRRPTTPNQGSKSLDSSPASVRKDPMAEGSRTPEGTCSAGEPEALVAGLSASFPSSVKAKGRKDKTIDDIDHTSIEDRFLLRELNIKSASAPILQPNRPLVVTGDGSSKEASSANGKGEDAALQEAKVFVAPRSHSAKELIELQALEACGWLRAAGFPQYAQMYEDNLFPIDIGTVQKDHAFLDPDSIQSLFRRLNTLNRCARMKIIDTGPRKSIQIDESDEEEQCALSENWQFQRTSRRWSRVPSPPASLTDGTCPNESLSSKAFIYSNSPVRKYLTPEEAYSSSHDSVFIEEHQNSSPDSVRRSAGGEERTHSMMLSPVSMEGASPASSSGSGGALSCGSEELLEKTLEIHNQALRRTGSDRIKEGAKALLRRMESLKGKRKKKKGFDQGSSDTPSDVFMTTVPNSGAETSPSSSVSQSPQMSHHQIRGESPPPEASDCSQGSTPQVKHRKKGWTILCKGDDTNAHSDSECPVYLMSDRWKDANYNETKLSEHFVASHTSVCLPNGTGVCDWRLKRDANSYSIHEENSIYSEVLREGQHIRKEHWLHPDTCNVKEGEKRGSFYDNIPAPVVVCNRTCSAAEGERQTIIVKSQYITKHIITRKREAEGRDTLSALSSRQAGSDQGLNEWQNETHALLIGGDRRDSGVGSSLTRHVVESCVLQAPWHCFPVQQTNCPRRKSLTSGMSINSLSAPQLMVLRKLSLLRLTTLMEKFSPSSRTGWSWGVPKFIRRICTPDYKDKCVFGVPLLLVLQRTGQPLPAPIQAAIRYLRKTALDCTGIFRKSGVRSRIQKLRNQTECCPERMSFEDQQAYDVADMLKQYFRELPEALLTNKLSETFISVYQHIPEELRLGAIQAAIMLMPDENREVLQCLLSFLQEICEHARENQMTATNLAVCFAPSLFHLSTPRSASASPRRRKTVGVPDQRELNENRAAYECLTSIILNYQLLFTVSEEQLSHCRLSYLEECEPARLEELTGISNKDNTGWKAYIDSCIQVLLKETREKFKGWVVVSQTENSDLAYKKMDDGHSLRLWKVSTEVEAPPVELLNRILRERHVWDPTLLKCRVVTKLDQQSEIFQYVCRSLYPHPHCDFCILRSWRSDLPKEACVLIEFSLDYPEAPPLLGVRGIVLASRYLIEPCGSGKSRVTHISRVDTRGRSPDWYNKVYGHMCSLQISHLRDSFNHGTEGPETKV